MALIFKTWFLLVVVLFLFVPWRELQAQNEPGFCGTQDVLGTCYFTLKSQCPQGRPFYPAPDSGSEIRQTCENECSTNPSSCGISQVAPPQPPQPPSPGSFIPLTNLPGLSGEGQRTLADYINVLFRLALGVGAMLAVIQIAYAGTRYMMTDAFGTKEQAKKDITGALLGLLIMLSTVVLLGLINQDILNINVLQGLTPLKPVNVPPAGPVQTGTGTTLARPNGETCAVNPNCQSAYCKPPTTGQISATNPGTCASAPVQTGLPQGAECSTLQQQNPCVTPLKCTATLTPCTTNVTGFCGKSTCQL